MKGGWLNLLWRDTSSMCLTSSGQSWRTLTLRPRAKSFVEYYAVQHKLNEVTWTQLRCWKTIFTSQIHPVLAPQFGTTYISKSAVCNDRYSTKNYNWHQFCYKNKCWHHTYESVLWCVMQNVYRAWHMKEKVLKVLAMYVFTRPCVLI